jgi:hypothetical protein
MRGSETHRLDQRDAANKGGVWVGIVACLLVTA